MLFFGRPVQHEQNEGVRALHGEESVMFRVQYNLERRGVFCKLCNQVNLTVPLSIRWHVEG